MQSSPRDAILGGKRSSRAGSNRAGRALEAFSAQVSSAAKAAGRAVPAADGVLKSLSGLVRDLNTALEGQRQAEVLRQKIEESGRRIERLQQQIKQRQREIDDLLVAAETADEETFRRLCCRLRHAVCWRTRSANSTRICGN